MHLKSSDVLPQRSGPFMKRLEHVVPKPILDYGQCIFNENRFTVILCTCICINSRSDPLYTFLRTILQIIY